MVRHMSLKKVSVFLLSNNSANVPMCLGRKGQYNGVGVLVMYIIEDSCIMSISIASSGSIDIS
jgi:hypothetical protein